MAVFSSESNKLVAAESCTDHIIGAAVAYRFGCLYDGKVAFLMAVVVVYELKTVEVNEADDDI